MVCELVQSRRCNDNYLFTRSAPPELLSARPRPHVSFQSQQEVLAAAHHSIQGNQITALQPWNSNEFGVADSLPSGMHYAASVLPLSVYSQ